jgi:hypothetical protein
MEDQMKIKYKPNYEPETEKELGDIWYYIRMLCRQSGNVPAKIESVIFPELDFELIFELADTDTIIAATSYCVSQQFLIMKDDNTWIKGVTKLFFNVQYSALIEIANRHNLTLDQLTTSNWEKLKPGSERGDQWMKARNG